MYRSERQRSVLHHGWRYRTLRPASAPNPRLVALVLTPGFAIATPGATFLNR